MKAFDGAAFPYGYDQQLIEEAEEVSTLRASAMGPCDDVVRALNWTAGKTTNSRRSGAMGLQCSDLPPSPPNGMMNLDTLREKKRGRMAHDLLRRSDLCAPGKEAMMKLPKSLEYFHEGANLPLGESDASVEDVVGTASPTQLPLSSQRRHTASPYLGDDARLLIAGGGANRDSMGRSSSITTSGGAIFMTHSGRSSTPDLYEAPLQRLANAQSPKTSSIKRGVFPERVMPLPSSSTSLLADGVRDGSGRSRSGGILAWGSGRNTNVSTLTLSYAPQLGSFTSSEDSLVL